MKRGEICLAGLDPSEGHEQEALRPVLLVSPEAFNQVTNVPIVLSHRQRRELRKGRPGSPSLYDEELTEEDRSKPAPRPSANRAARKEHEGPLSLSRTIARRSSQSRPSPSGALRAALTAPGRREKAA